VQGSAFDTVDRCSSTGPVLAFIPAARSSFRDIPVGPALEHDPEKWTPVFRKDHAPTKKLDHDPIQFDRIMV
jgi:hypothetical protein